MSNNNPAPPVYSLRQMNSACATGSFQVTYFILSFTFILFFNGIVLSLYVRPIFTLKTGTITYSLTALLSSMDMLNLMTT